MCSNPSSRACFEMFRHAVALLTSNNFPSIPSIVVYFSASPSVAGVNLTVRSFPVFCSLTFISADSSAGKLRISDILSPVSTAISTMSLSLRFSPRLIASISALVALLVLLPVSHHILVVIAHAQNKRLFQLVQLCQPIFFLCPIPHRSVKIFCLVRLLPPVQLSFFVRCLEFSC